jgi:SAM-dependent methyltransferase
MPEPAPEPEPELEPAAAAAAAAADAETAALIDEMADEAAESLWDEADERWCCPFVPSVAARIERLITFLELNDRDTLLDIGCGEGHVLVLAAQLVGCRCIGMDVDEALLDTARQSAAAAGVGEQCSWLRCDFRDAEAAEAMGQATAICTFLVPSALRLLAPTLAAHMQLRQRQQQQLAGVGGAAGSEAAAAVTALDAEELQQPALRVASMVYHFDEEEGKEKEGEGETAGAEHAAQDAAGQSVTPSAASSSSSSGSSSNSSSSSSSSHGSGGSHGSSRITTLKEDSVWKLRLHGVA